MENRSYTNARLNCETKFAVTWRAVSREGIFPIQRFNKSLARQSLGGGDTWRQPDPSPARFLRMQETLSRLIFGSDIAHFVRLR